MKKEEKTEAASARRVALDILQAVLHRRAAFDETLERSAPLHALEGRDRGFAHLLVATVLRRLGQIDAAITACLDKPEALKPLVQDLLRLGAAQLLFLQTPPHAAVNTALDLAAADPALVPYKGFLNAVLRRLSREGQGILATQDGAALNIPAWLRFTWRDAYGPDVARLMSEASLGEALTDLSFKEDPQAMAESIGGRLLPTGGLRLSDPRPVQELPGFAEGSFWVQDAAASFPVRLFGKIAGQRVVDLCAAPGGKTAQLAASGARVTSLDRSAPRLKRLQENLARLQLQAEVSVQPAEDFQPAEKFPFVLLDAPCSSTGTIRRHPDILRLKKKEDVARLAETQTRLLDHALAAVLAPGGTLVYAVCSLQPEEGKAQIDSLLKRCPSVRRKPVTPGEVPGADDFITKEGDLLCLPHQWADLGGIDGFFASRLILDDFKVRG